MVSSLRLKKFHWPTRRLVTRPARCRVARCTDTVDWERPVRWSNLPAQTPISNGWSCSTKYFSGSFSQRSMSRRTVPVIAKLEKPQAIENLDEIIDAFDAVMVARGDMAVECPLEEVPLIQKQIIEKARLQAKPAIVATQMLESMIHAPRPTRAEAADVANAILDGADGVMTSAETSVGDFPGETVRTMAKIVESTEAHGLDKIAKIDWDPHTTGGIMSKAAAEIAERAEAKFIVAFTKSGDTARRIARLRPSTPLIVFTPDETTTKDLAWVWGAHAVVTPVFKTAEELYRWVNAYLRDKGFVPVGDRVVVLSGSPMDIPSKTNDLRILRIKEDD